MKALDRRVVESMTGKAKLWALLNDYGFPTNRAVAGSIQASEEDVSRCMNGHIGRRGTMERIRDGIAKLCAITRAEVDTLLGPLEINED